MDLRCRESQYQKKLSWRESRYQKVVHCYESRCQMGLSSHGIQYRKVLRYHETQFLKQQTRCETETRGIRYQRKRARRSRKHVLLPKSVEPRTLIERE